MKTRAFTLVELLIVIVILGVLLALLVPVGSRAWAVAHATWCRDNLRQIYNGFYVHRAQAGELAGLFPKAEQFPFIPKTAMESPRTFICPEDDHDADAGGGQMAVTDLLALLVYINRPRSLEISFADPDHQGFGHMHLGTWEGSDAKGDYIEIGLNDNSPITENYINNWESHDGIIRVYPNIGGTAIAKLIKYSCGEYNCVLFDGQPVFVSPSDTTDPNNEAYGWLGPDTSKNGMEVELGVTVAMRCSYGMTVGAEQFQSGVHKILVIDHPKLRADYTRPDFQEMLEESARHLGYINILFSDGSVQSFSPMEIDPLVPDNHRLWEP
ncbi:MAG TPA: type II secretion system protein [Phycisphaerae bacterium]|nr:type II secretion system protein [Phycisphaerae bacterium]